MTKNTTWLVAAVLPALLAGCASGPDEKEFGRSVRAMIEAQTYDPGQPVSVAPLDGASAELALKQYREPAAATTMDVQLAK